MYCVINQREEQLQIFHEESSITITFDMLNDDRCIRQAYSTLSREAEHQYHNVNRPWTRGSTGSAMTEFNHLVAKVQAYVAPVNRTIRIEYGASGNTYLTRDTVQLCVSPGSFRRSMGAYRWLVSFDGNQTSGTYSDAEFALLEDSIANAPAGITGDTIYTIVPTRPRARALSESSVLA